MSLEIVAPAPGGRDLAGGAFRYGPAATPGGVSATRGRGLPALAQSHAGLERTTPVGRRSEEWPRGSGSAAPWCA